MNRDPLDPSHAENPSAAEPARSGPPMGDPTGAPHAPGDGAVTGTPEKHDRHHSEQPHGGATLTVLRVGALLTALGSLAQGVMGLMIGFGSGPLGTHSTVGMITMVLAIVTGVASALWSRRGGNTGLMMHALTVAVLGILQYGLGEMGLKTVHMVIGVLFLVAAVALATLAYRKPYAANPHASLNESTHHTEH